MKRSDDHVTLPVVGPHREDVERAQKWDTATLDLQCYDDEGYEQFAEIAHELSLKHKQTCGERDEIIKPINAGVKRIRDMYAPVIKSLKAAEDRVKQAMVDYRLEQKRIKDQAELDARRAIEAGDHEAMIVHAAKVVEPAPAAAGTHVRKTWKIRVTDETKVPREFLTVDTAALKRYAIANAWKDAPDGVEFYQEEGITLR